MLSTYLADIYKKMMRSGNAVSSHSGLILPETLVRKKRGIALADCEEEEFH